MNGIQVDLSFKTTDDLTCLDGLIGQERGKKAMEFGLAVEAEGYNIYISGEPGTGKTTLAKDYAQKSANQKPVPNDWCYVYNFRDKRVPKTLSFDSGDGRRFKSDMIELIEYLTMEIPYICKQPDKDIECEVGLQNVGYYIKMLKEKYVKYHKVIMYLCDLQRDILDHIEVFINEGENLETLISKYEVNLLVDHSKGSGAPVIIGNCDLYNELFGTRSTSYMEVKAGLFHQAIGGYLILQVADILNTEDAWDTIKRVLKRKKLAFGTPMDTKIILVGSPDIYNRLYESDPDFKQFFKVKAGIESSMSSNRANIKLVARFIKTFCQEHLLLPFSSEGVKGVIKYAIGHTGDQKRVTAQFGWVGGLVLEASIFARLEESEIAEEKHVHQAISQRKYRAGFDRPCEE